MADIIDLVMEAQYGPDAEGPPLTQEFIDSLRVERGTQQHMMQVEITRRHRTPTLTERREAALAALRARTELGVDNLPGWANHHTLDR